MKYNEDKILKEIEKFINETYDPNYHYQSEDGIQTFDVWRTNGSAETTCRDNAIKYLMRYGKKNGYNKKDLLKCIHFIILMINERFVDVEVK